MNFYNPYLYSLPTNFAQPKIGLLGRLFGKTGVSISGFLNGTQRILNIANQTIPLVKQVKPMIGNAKTMFKVMNEFKRTERSINDDKTINLENENKTNTTQEKTDQTNSLNIGPTFFI